MNLKTFLLLFKQTYVCNIVILIFREQMYRIIPLTKLYIYVFNSYVFISIYLYNIEYKIFIIAINAELKFH